MRIGIDLGGTKIEGLVLDKGGVERDRQFHGRSSSIRWAGCSAIRARTSASQA